MCTPHGAARTPRPFFPNARSLSFPVALPPIAPQGGREPAAMGYRGKVKEQAKARALRAQNHTLAEIAETLGVSKSSVSLWVRDVPFTPTLRLRGPHRRPHPAHDAKLREIEELNRQGAARIGTLSEEAFFIAGVALYAGEGSKTVLLRQLFLFANTPRDHGSGARAAIFVVLFRG